MALQISGNSPRAVQGTKLSLNYSSNHSIQDSLDQVELILVCYH